MMTLLILLALYFLPTIIARDKKGVTGIFLLNFFLGWTFIGYIIALIWALAASPAEAEGRTASEELMRLDHLHKEGVLTWSESER
jgi:hypothetical protein